MDPHTKEILRDIQDKVEENNAFLKKMHRAQMWGRIFRIIYWVIIIGIAVGAYYFIEPYITSVWETYQGISAGVDSAQQSAVDTSSRLDRFLERFGF